MELICRDCKATMIIDKQLTSCPQCGSIYIDIYDGSKNLIYSKKNDITGIKEIKTDKWNSDFCCFFVMMFILLIIFLLFGEAGLNWVFSWF